MTSKIFTAILAALLFTACSKNFTEQDFIEPLAKDNGVVVLSAGFYTTDSNDASTRTTLGPKDGNSWPNLWSEGDAICVNGVASNALTASEAGSSTASFTISGVSAPFQVAYPAASLSSYSKGEASISIPYEQQYIEGSYDSSAWVMLANSSSETISLVPQMAIMCITPTGSGGSIKSISITDLGSGALAGNFSTDFSTLTPISSYTSKTVTVTSATGVAEGKPWMIVIPASDFCEDGFRLTVTTTDNRCFIRTGRPSKAYSAGKVYSFSIDLKHSTAVLSASAGNTTSSSISFSWSHDGYDTQDEVDKTYLISLYANAACTDMLVSHLITPSDACWNNSTPRFVFGGLNPSTKYWFIARDVTGGITSAPVSATTKAFTPVDARYVSNASAGQVILAEDFSEIGWGSSEFDYSAGFYPTDPDLTVPSGLITSEDGRYEVYNANHIRLFDITSISSSDRLSGWGFFGNSSVYAYAGYLRVGVTASGARTHIVSPALAGIPNGKDAVIDVTVTSCRNEANDNDVAVFLEDGSSITHNKWKYYGVTLSEGYPLGTKSREWSTSTVRIAGVSNTNRLVFGSLSNIDTKNRFCITDIQVRIVSLSPSSNNKAQFKVAAYNVLKPSSHPDETSLSKSETRNALYLNIAGTGASIIGFNEIDSNYLPEGDYSLPDICSSLGSNWQWELYWPNNIKPFKAFTYTYANGFAYDSSVLALEDDGYVWLSQEEETWYANWWSAYEKVGSPMRTCVWALMRHIESGLRFYFLVTHLPTASQGGGESMATGVNGFAESLDASLPKILVGDMNSATSGNNLEPYAKLKEYWADACETVADAGGTDMTSRGTLSGSSSSYYYSVSTFTKNHPDRRIDHVMTKGACRASTYGTPYVTFDVSGNPWCPSDHLPVVATIDFPKK